MTSGSADTTHLQAAHGIGRLRHAQLRAALLVLALWPLCVSVRGWPQGVDDSRCAAHLSLQEYAALKALVDANPVALVAMAMPMRCTIAATARLDALHACYAQRRFTDTNYKFGDDASISHPLWKYHVCQYPDNKVGSIQMHSYLWVGQQMYGNGFDLLTDKRDGRIQPGRWLSQDALSAKLEAAACARTCLHGVRTSPQEV